MLNELVMDKKELKLVDSFVFLSLKIATDEQCAREMKMKLILRKKGMTNLDKDTLMLIKLIVKTVVFPIQICLLKLSFEKK